MDDFHRKLKDRIDSAVTQDIIIKSRKTALNSIRQKHIALELQMPLEDYKKKFRSIKNHAIANLSHLVDLATIRLRENGCNVYHANKVQDVLKILDNIIDDSLVVKCKTNMAKEIRLKEYLESRKIEIVETDLGDRIVQLSQSHASHPLIPSLHIPKAQAAKLFHITKDPQQLTIKEIVNVARAGLRDIVLKAKISISGANAITAEEGLICLEENEGNQRLITSLARKHIVLAGIDKVVPTAEDAVRIMKDAAYYGLASRSGVYLSLISGPSRTGDIDFELTYGMHGPEEVHVILIDNGRQQIITAGYEELLYCVNCGGCVNYCPVYEEIGEAFGNETYIGGRGVLYLSHVENIRSGFQNGLYFCTGCQACTISCPSSIDTYTLMLKTRSEAITQNLVLAPHQKILDSINQFSNPFQEPQASRCAWLSDPPTQYAKKTDTLLFLGCMASYRVQPQANSAIALLNHLNIPFTYLGTEEPCCGSVLRNTGFDEQFAAVQMRCKQKLSPFSEILTICPGCYSTFKTSYSDFFHDHNIRLKHLIEILPEHSDQFKSSNLKITYHDPCHLGRHFNLYDPPRVLFKNLQLQFQEMTLNKDKARCCGAGAGVLSAFPLLAKKIAETRMQDAVFTKAEALLTACPFCAYNLSQVSSTIPVYSIQEFLMDNK